jgi:cold shock CspA family protein
MAGSNKRGSIVWVCVDRDFAWIEESGSRWRWFAHCSAFQPRAAFDAIRCGQAVSFEAAVPPSRRGLKAANVRVME